jgi:osmoprotectant transport system substrate-binding protein
MTRVRVFLLLLGLIAGLGAATEVSAQTVKVGSKNFTEQYIMAEIYAAALENAGIKVERKINLGGTLIAHKALTTGEIDVYPEYTGTGLSSVLKAETMSDPKAVYEKVKAFYEEQFKCTWLTPTALNSSYAMAVRPETAEKYGLKTLSDLAKVAKELTIGGGPEFPDRKDGLPGLKAVYGIEFKEFRQFAKLALRYDALAAGQIEVANGVTTDWQIVTQKFVVLADDKGLFPPYYAAPVIRQAVLADNPKIAEILNAVSATIDTATMRQLNAKVEVDKDEPKDVARAFLKEKGLIK